MQLSWLSRGDLVKVDPQRPYDGWVDKFAAERRSAKTAAEKPSARDFAWRFTKSVAIG